jgi:hypothetical protein
VVNKWTFFGILVLWYHRYPRIVVELPMPEPSLPLKIDRVQTGVRMERRLVKVLKALAEYKNLTLGDLLEGIVLHAFEGKVAFTSETLGKIAELKSVYELDFGAEASHRLEEKP